MTRTVIACTIIYKNGSTESLSGNLSGLNEDKYNQIESLFKKYLNVDNSTNPMAYPGANANGPMYPMYANNIATPPGAPTGYIPNQALNPDFACYNPNQAQIYYGAPNINSGYPQNIQTQHNQDNVVEINNKPDQSDFGAPSIPQ